jgi:antitoxin component YwqK of YwqJK toxin-antitoxin module
MLRPWLAVAALVSLSASTAVGGETLREVDAFGRVRVVREVVEDARGNCVNHGSWQLVDERGRVGGGGQYDMGRRVGVWRRDLTAADVTPDLAPLVAGFDAPFVSTANYQAGQLSGPWTIADARGRVCVTIQFAAGVRHGDLHAWAPSGHLVLSEHYEHGQLDGAALVWSAAEGRLVHAATWVKGYRLVRSVALHEGPITAPRSEGEYLLGPRTATTLDDAWTGRLAAYQTGEQCLPHGQWQAWFPGGQLAAAGRYDWGRPAGEFVWRHANGQKAAAGGYDGAGRPAGVWRWWNADGVQVAVRSPAGGAGGLAPQVAQRPASPADAGGQAGTPVVR